jgi:chromate transporter
MTNRSQHVSYITLFWTFLKIGSTAFGGFMALISVVQNYVVERRQLLSQEAMLDGISLATILPGPIAMNVVAYVGYKLRGGLGALVCTVAVTIPTFIFILILSYGYFTWGEVPSVNKFFQGFIPAVAAIIISAVWNMGRKNLKAVPELIIATAACAILILIGGFSASLIIIISAGVAGYWLFREAIPPINRMPPEAQDSAKVEKNAGGRKFYSATVIPILSTAAPFLSTDLFMAGKLLVTFAVMSLFLFGGGFVFIPLIQEVVVDGYGWVTHKESIAGIALGQVTPGPILISAAFIGYKMSGLLGATAATLGIFTPPALVMIFCAHHLERVKKSIFLKAGMRGIRAAVIGMILAAAFVVGSTAEMNWISILIFTASLVALLKFKWEVAIIIPGAGTLGVLLY